jgi:beta-galactosidase
VQNAWRLQEATAARIDANSHGPEARVTGSNAVREVFRLDAGWKFHLGEIDSPLPNKHIAAYMANKAGFARGAAKKSYDDSDWRPVDLPHDWSIEGAFDRSNHVNAGFLPRGIAWYRRYFRLDECDRGRYLALRFDGVATHCTVWVNGHLLHRNFCGYTPFTIDISDIANSGDTLNCITVRVDATYPEGWWYEGAGIYRHVWLIKASAVHVATDGIFVNPTRTFEANWDTQIQTMIENTSDGAMRCELHSRIVDPRGAAVDTVQSVVEVPSRSLTSIHQSIPIANPSLWSCESPSLYSLCTEIRCDGKPIDDVTTRFGYRTIRFDPAKGFFLNEQPLKLLGTCNHQDHAGVGVAVPDSIQEFRIRRLKEMGSNAYRCAHNPPAPELLDACDRLGMLVMDENRNFGSSPEHLAQLRAMVMRDRNHPSVILWSICNEEAIQGEPTGAKIARAMIEQAHELDPSRPITAAVSGGILNEDCIATEIDVMGINYQLHTYDPFHAKHPHKPLIAAETHCALSTRGVYQTDRERFVFASYDEDKAFWGNTARQTWRAIWPRPFVAGMFAWTGFDYRGEPSPHEWPCISSHWGILDTCGFEKDAFFLHKAWFTREPFVHLLPHWNWPGKDGAPIRVAAYTNCDEVQLFLNERSLDRKPVDPIEMVEWPVPYEPGALKALAFRQGQLLAQLTVQTTGAPTALGLEIHSSFDASVIPADGEFSLPITVFALDAAGRRVPDANPFVRFALTGPATNLGVGNGDPTCHEPDKARQRSLFNGLAQVLVQTTTTPGEIILTASADGLQAAELRIHSTPANLRPSIPPAIVRHFIPDWRMSPITAHRPDPNQALADTDMNSWERIDPARGAQAAWAGKQGHAIYRATFTPPKSLQSSGGRIVFHQIAGTVDVFLNGVAVGHKSESDAGAVVVRFHPTSEKQTLSLLLSSGASLAGLLAPIEILPHK